MGVNPAKVKGGIFMDKTYPANGMFGFNMYVRGRPWKVYVDDYLPFYNNALYLLRKGNSGNYWAPILEKAAAKVFVNYENLSSGW